MNDGSNSELSLKLLSDIVVYNKYAKYIPEYGRRETFDEIVDRNMQMHIKKYPQLKEEIEGVYNKFVKTRKVVPSMRALQFSGKPIELNPARQFNCSFLPIDNYRAFSEVIFLLLSGTGVGVSVQKSHVEKLPPIRKPLKTRRFVIGDSIEGWSDSVKALISAYMLGKSLPKFDYSDIRPKGARLVTSGGKAPGPQPLKDCLEAIQKILDSKSDGDQLTELEVHDIICLLADCVLAGGIRRAALISLFDLTNEDMLTCKYSDWWKKNGHRARANNSATILRHKVKKKDFDKLWERIKNSQSGEPGFMFSNNCNWGYNPCSEIGLESILSSGINGSNGGGGFCNLSELKLSDVTTQEELEDRAKAAAFIGTLQAGYTDFHYLRDGWKKLADKASLLGVSSTGIAGLKYDKLNLSKAVQELIKENQRIAKIIGIRSAERYTCVKPSGTTSTFFGTSSGIHAWFDEFYIRRIKLGKNEALYKYLLEKVPQLIEDDQVKPHLDAFVKIPIAAPKDAIIAKNETAIQFLERVKYFYQNWILPGHIKGDNTHNVSATVYIKDHEWDGVREWLWENRNYYAGISVLPFDGGTYTQAPHESITKEKYEEMLQYLKEVDLTEIYEGDDNTDLRGELACAGGACEIK